MIDRRPQASKEGARLWETLDEEAAEAVRSQLVVLRGGAPFLSPDDARLLGTWLDQGWTAAQIVHALERAADARRRRPRRTPLSLRSARPHLGKASKGALPPSARSEPRRHPLQAIADALRAAAVENPRADALNDLADQLLALPTDDLHLLEARAGTLGRDFLRRAWEDMAAWERRARLDDALESLSGLGDLLTPAALQASAEEIARDQLRQRYPWISAATIRQALGLAPERPS